MNTTNAAKTAGPDNQTPGTYKTTERMLWGTGPRVLVRVVVHTRYATGRTGTPRVSYGVEEGGILVVETRTMRDAKAAL